LPTCSTIGNQPLQLSSSSARNPHIGSTMVAYLGSGPPNLALLLGLFDSGELLVCDPTPRHSASARSGWQPSSKDRSTREGRARVIRYDLSRACRLRVRPMIGVGTASLGGASWEVGVVPNAAIDCLSNLLVPCHKCSRIMVLLTGPSRNRVFVRASYDVEIATYPGRRNPRCRSSNTVRPSR
jgi:hypothetical protein